MNEVKSQEPERLLTADERLLIEKLLASDFPGCRELRAAFDGEVSVRNIDEFGSLSIKTSTEQRAPVLQRVPVEAEAHDVDGIVIHVQLHVVEGLPVELEIYKEDLSTVRTMPNATSFSVFAPSTRPNWMDTSDDS